MVDDETDDVAKGVREQSQRVGVESAELGVKLEASGPRIEPVEKAMYAVDETRLQPVSEQRIDVVVVEEGSDGASERDVVEDEPERVEEGVVVELAPEKRAELARTEGGLVQGGRWRGERRVRREVGKSPPVVRVEPPRAARMAAEDDLHESRVPSTQLPYGPPSPRPQTQARRRRRRWLRKDLSSHRLRGEPFSGGELRPPLPAHRSPPFEARRRTYLPSLRTM